MTINKDIPAVLKYAAYVLIATASLGILLAYNVKSRGDFRDSFLIFIAIMTSVNVMVGIGILSRAKWGILLLNGFLYFYLLAFPIGTYLSRKALEYLKNNNIDRYYS